MDRSTLDRPPGPDVAPDAVSLPDIVVCSLEPWDDVWRRNQFLVDQLLGRNPLMRVLFVEPAADVLFDLWSRHLPARPRFRTISSDRRLRAFRPLKPLPRKLGSMADRALLRQVLFAVRAASLHEPLLWINDVTYAPLVARTGWPSLYDVTDDWLLAPLAPRELERLRHLDDLALRTADEVVVCSRVLAASRGERRQVSLIPNGVDVAHFRRPRERPPDLPAGPVAVYMGTLHESRLDVGLVTELANALPRLTIALVGPVALSDESQRRLARPANVRSLGARPYGEVPAYLQHADVIVVPHVVSAFTESLDPIKAYECLAVATPTVATPVAGFRELEPTLNVVARDSFVERVAQILDHGLTSHRRIEPIAWEERAAAFEGALSRARAHRRKPAA